MFAAVKNIIPVATSEAGLALTAANWQEANVTALSYSLEFLLHKPGLQLLKKIPDLSAYLGWDGLLVLNAASLVANKEGIIALKSPYDGAKTQVTALELLELIAQLRPDAVVLPPNIFNECEKVDAFLPHNVFPFVHASDLRHNIEFPHGVYVREAELDLLKPYSHLQFYVMDIENIQQVTRLRAQGIHLLETNAPAQAAITGTVYREGGVVDVSDNAVNQEFTVIDPKCTCSPCTQKLTQAYLHHLFHHTPLLCQRFLIQHNVFAMANT